METDKGDQSSDTKGNQWTCSSTRASSTSPATTSRCRRAASPTPSTRRSPRPRRAGYPVVVKAQVQVGGRGKAGGIKLADNADEVRLHAGNILGMDIKGHVVKRVWVEHASDIDEGVLRVVHARSCGQEAPADAQRRGWRRDRDGRRRPNPDAIVMLHIDPVDGLSLGGRSPGGGRREDRRRGRRRRGRHARQAVPLLHRGRLRPRRDQPADPAARRRGARARRQGQPRQQRRVPPSRVGRVPGDRRARRARADGPHSTTCSTSASTAPSASSPTAPVWR